MTDKLAKTSLNEVDARRLLARAAEIESDKPLDLDANLSLAEVERAGREAGIEPSSIRRAAEELGLLSREAELEPLREHDHALVIDRALPGVLDDEALDRLVSAARSAFAGLGQTERSGDTLAWRTAPGAPRQVELTVERIGGETRIRIVEDVTPLHRAGLYLVGGLGGILALAATLVAWLIATDPGQQALLAILMGGGTGLGFGALFGSRIYRRYLRHHAAPRIERLRRLVEEAVPRLPPKPEDAVD